MLLRNKSFEERLLAIIDDIGRRTTFCYNYLEPLTASVAGVYGPDVSWPRQEALEEATAYVFINSLSCLDMTEVFNWPLRVSVLISVRFRNLLCLLLFCSGSDFYSYFEFSLFAYNRGRLDLRGL